MSKHSFQLHAYSGRENGLMIIGDAEALKTLGQELQKAATYQPPANSENWPQQVAVLSTSSPYADREDYQVSIHLQTAPLPEVLRKRSRSAPSTAVFLAITFLALVGAISLPLWLWRAL
jgi:hypothetical protein